MNIGYVQDAAVPKDLRSELAAFDNAGCERIVVDSAARAKERRMLKVVLDSLSAGDSLVVWSLSCVADSMPELVRLALDLEARKVRLISLAEGFDTNGEDERVVISTLRRLHAFQESLATQRDGSSRRRPGRPRMLKMQDLDKARLMLANGATVDEAARELNISRATLYRYLHQ
ncbi:recombinase family protein [Methyloligella solikamskensis]|uniref:Recombinase family protein n=1 Tax=Methyloligella solikamskensis TaxID=1177756 RepID=A0ABW3JB97_9HYPH